MVTGDFSCRLVFFFHILNQARKVPIGLGFDLEIKSKIVAPRQRKSVVMTAAKTNRQSGAVNGLEFWKKNFDAGLRQKSDVQAED